MLSLTHGQKNELNLHVVAEVDHPPSIPSMPGDCTAAGALWTVEMYAIYCQKRRMWFIVITGFTDLIRRLIPCTVTASRLCTLDSLTK